MFKFYKVKEYLNIDGKKIFLGTYDEIKSPERRDQIIPIDTFQELWDLAERSPYLYRSITVFTSKKEVFFYDANDSWEIPKKFNEDKFKAFQFEKTFEEFQPTVKYLQKHLTFEEFLKYEEDVKEHIKSSERK